MTNTTLLLAGAAYLLPALLYALSFRKTAAVVRSLGGKAPGASVWLLLLPFIGFLWFAALLYELRQAIDQTEIGPSANSAWWKYGWLSVLFELAQFLVEFRSGAWLLLALAGLGCFVIHWTKLVALREELGRAAFETTWHRPAPPMA